MLGWLVFGLAAGVILLLAGLLSRFRGRGHLGVLHSIDYHVSENESHFQQPH